MKVFLVPMRRLVRMPLSVVPYWNEFAVSVSLAFFVLQVICVVCATVGRIFVVRRRLIWRVGSF